MRPMRARAAAAVRSGFNARRNLEGAQQLVAWVRRRVGVADEILRSEIVDYRSLDISQRAILIQELATVSENVFDHDPNLSPAEEVRHCLGEPCYRRRIEAFRNQDGVMVGFNIISNYHLETSQGKVAVFRAWAGLVREYRGRSSTLGFALREALRQRMMYPRMPIYLFLVLIHPSSYRLFRARVSTLYTCFDEQAPTLASEIVELCLANETRAVRSERGRFLVKDRIRVQDSAADGARWRADPSTADFVAANPGYSEGWGLATLIPLDLYNLTSGYASFMKRSVANAAQRRAPGEVQLVSPPDRRA
jgi:hypothetical protein